jgi:hypothetical protein
VGFYYGPGKPPDDDEPGGIKEAMLITLIVFRTLALPLGLIIGGIAYLVLTFYLFTLHPLAGAAAILVVVAAVGARAIWEKRHPPTLPE